MGISLKRSEHELQKTIFDWADLYANRWPQLRLLFAIPNGGLRNKIVAKKLKAEGVKAGVPDVFFAYPANGFHGFFAECKIKPNRPTKEQSRFLQQARENGYYTSVWYTVEEAIIELKAYIQGKLINDRRI